MVFAARRSYASAVLGVVILSVCPSVRVSVCHTRALWLIQRTYRRYFYTTWKGSHSSQMWFFVQLCSSWQDFNWLKGSHGLSAAAELLVLGFRFSWLCSVWWNVRCWQRSTMHCRRRWSDVLLSWTQLSPRSRTNWRRTRNWNTSLMKSFCRLLMARSYLLIAFVVVHKLPFIHLITN